MRWLYGSSLIRFLPLAKFLGNQWKDETEATCERGEEWSARAEKARTERSMTRVD